MDVLAVNTKPDITVRTKNVAPGSAFVANKQQVQQPNQGLSEDTNNDAFYEEQIKKVIEKANQSLAEHSTKLAFAIHEQTKEIMVKVLDADSGEIIKEIPSQKSLDRLAVVLEDIGWLVDRKI